MQKNIAGQKWICFAFDTTTGLPKTGDLLNITANLRLDGGAANPVDDTNPAELEGGYYAFDITQAETNADMIVICPSSVTANIAVIGVPGVVYTESDFTATMKASLNAATPASVQNIPATGSGFTAIPTVARVTLVDTCSVNSDMRGTNGALTDKAGFSLSATGADLILHGATFMVALATAVWELGTRVLTAGTNIVLAKGTGVTGFNDIAAGAQMDLVNAPNGTAITAINSGVLSKLLKYVQLLARKDVAIATDNATELTAINASGGTGVGTFDNTTDSEQGIRDNTAWNTATGFATPTSVTDAVSALETYGDGHWAEQGGLTKEAIRTEMDTNSTKLIAIKAKTDTLGGAGAITWTYTVTDSITALPIADVDVWATTDSAGANIIASTKTNASGVATFYLDAGTVYIWRQKSGYTFVNPDTEVIV